MSETKNGKILSRAHQPKNFLKEKKAIPYSHNNIKLRYKVTWGTLRKEGCPKYGIFCYKIQITLDIYPEKNLQTYPGVVCGTGNWNNTYKIRTVVERDINHNKEKLCLAGRRTQNKKTLHADLIPSGITQLITVVPATNSSLSLNKIADELNEFRNCLLLQIQ